MTVPNGPGVLLTLAPGETLPGALDEARVGYWLGLEGVWYLYLPGIGVGALSLHTILVHEDGTITASPSIRLGAGGSKEAHGFLERGVWRNC